MIFIVDPASKQPLKIEPVSFYDLGIKERQDLEEWVKNDPELLGERLLIITSEFDKFDHSDRRLDILALDLDGFLVIAELKLDINGSLADQQAIRYAAFCSTMTMNDIVNIYSANAGSSIEEASEKICEFLEVDELPELGNSPRIILAAGSFDDRELTSCVLWLRNFKIDISCVELTPYRIYNSSQIILVPRIIIPVPEIKNHLIEVERKEALQLEKAKQKSQLKRLWQAISNEFEALGGQFGSISGSLGLYQQIRFDDNPSNHYEWFIIKRHSRLSVALHFENPDKDENLRLLNVIKSDEERIRKDINLEFRADLARKWAQVEFRIPYEGDLPNPTIAPEAARLMKTLIERTWPLIEHHVGK